ncbi:MAG TPA: ADP-ribosylglycohydrolase family protein [Roseiflexaceae bacterium]|nr:ADP-ribosylglycohydrolase family protein [Roseiflexaceae bacterium]
MRRASGCLFGMALGDALAAPVEFLRVPEILERYPPDGPRALEGDPARVTDDTQMALAVGEALLAAPRPLTPAGLEGPLRRAFVEWADSPENNRAPGVTCLRACDGLRAGLPWPQATVASSKGCGANMRVQPVALLSFARDGVGPDERAAIAQFQAALTHGHPTGLAAADLTAAAIRDLLDGGDPKGLPSRLRAYAHNQRGVYHARWLGPLWQQPSVDSPETFITRGWDECLAGLDRLEAALARGDREADPCLATGEGWVAEEALMTGLLCFLLFPKDGVAALRRAAVTAGDSDSIACLAGSFAGAHLGLDAWPADWLARIEYRDRLQRLGEVWDG